MSGPTRPRKRKAPAIDPPSLEDIALPMAQQPRLENDDRDVPVKDWTTDIVVGALQEKEIGEDILQLFREHKIKGKHLATLNQTDLTSMGINAVGTQKDVLEAVRALTYRNRMEKVFNDPVHGHIQLHPLMVKFIDTPQFQRLRYIKQLGGGYYVFPGASHNRFEHSIGVGYLAGELVETLQRKQRELDITDVDVLCVKLGGLCHDLGHGPFSHLFDGKFIPNVLPDSNWQHEDASVMMLDHLIEENGLKKDMEGYGLVENDLLFIKELIVGPIENGFITPDKIKRYKGRPESKSFLYEIVANKTTGVDVDKWDYFARDCHHLGIPNGFDLRRYMAFVRVIEVDGRLQLCTRDKEATNLYEMFHTRSILHRKAYQHKTSNIIELMITEALVAANDYLMIPGKNGNLKMSEAIYDPVAFTRLTDQVLQQIQLSSDPRLKKAQDILAKVERRHLYKFIGQTQAQSALSKVDESRICREIIESFSPEEQTDLPLLLEDDIIVLIATFDYGKKADNPIDLVRFYAKESPHTASKVRKDQVSRMLPPTFREQQIRVFCRKDDKPSLEAARKYFTKWCSKQKSMAPSGHEENPLADTTLTNSPYVSPPSLIVEPSHTVVRSTAVRNLIDKY